MLLVQGLAFVVDLFQVEELSEQTLKLPWFVDAPPQLPKPNAARPHCREELGLHYVPKQFLQGIRLQERFSQCRAQ